MFADGHSDYLYKRCNNEITVSDMVSLKAANVIMQNYAIYVDPQEMNSHIEQEIYKQLHFFKSDALKDKNIVHVKSSNDVNGLVDYINLNKLYMLKNNQIFNNLKEPLESLYAILSLEGCDGIANNYRLFDVLWEQGVRIFGLTWNLDNLFATSCHTNSKSGLTSYGIQFVKKLIEKRGIIDVSHISEASFWDIHGIGEHAETAIIASHSNCKKICNHRRNLTNEQIQAIIKMKGVIGVNFVPDFLNQNGKASIVDVIKHIDAILELGGIHTVAIGSDFDGANLIDDLSEPKLLFNLANELNKLYTMDIVNRILFFNWFDFYYKNLPK